jgi:DNA-directed RNA polymerase II subunit RPB1
MGDTIIGVQFGIANPADIVKRSVVEVITDKTYSGNQPVPNGVFDARFGVIENGKVCPTCKQTNLLCPGHFGHIVLARPVYLYQFLDHIQKILQIICLNCSNPYLSDEQLEEIEKTFKGIDRFDEVREQTKDYKGTREIRTNPECRYCKTLMIKKVDRQELTTAVAPLQLEAKMMPIGESELEPVLLQPEMILRCFQRITDRHVELIGLNPKFSRPDWMICTVLAVPPLSVRPTVMDDNQRMEDDLTHKLIDIVRDNQRLRDRIDKGDSRDNIDKWTGLLQHHVATYVDNDIKGLTPAHQRSGRPLKTLKSRLGAKTGRVRGNLMGKRVDFSARSVITPDPNIELDELGVPEEIAKNLTFPEIVTQYNRDRLMSSVRNGPYTHPGAKSVNLLGEARPLNLKFANPELINLKEGDIVHRHLIDGDVVLFNRQPSLHKASMECHRIKVLPYSTFRLNVSATKPYNADFDGDEMNMHVPQSITAATELKYLASVLRQIISPRKNSPIIEIVQDTMTGAYRISNPKFIIPEHVAMNILARTKRPLSSLKRRNDTYTAPELISNVFPLIDHDGAGIKIKDGKLMGGRLAKKAFSSASEGIIHYIYNEFGPQRCGQFINDVQSVVTKFNLYQGFSVGTSDLIADSQMITFVKETIDKGKKDIANIIASVHEGTFYNDTGGSRPDGEELENRISKALKEVSKDVSEVAMKSLSDDNRMKQMVESGAKGDIWNICQMIAILPQQLVSGKRIQYTLQDRTLPHFAKYDHGMESHGFVENSFISGLRPAEFFFHAMGGREGLIDTAVKTSDSGYIQRKLVKNMEDLHIEYDGTVRNSNGSIIQFNYGGDGIDSICVEQQSCELGVMSMEDVYRNFGLSKDDVAAVVNGEIKEPIDDMVEQLLLDRDVLVKDVFRFVKDDKILAPVHLKRITEKFKNNYATKTDLTPDYVVAELNKLSNKNLIKHNKLFQILLRYYLAPKKSIMILRYTKEIFDEVLREIQFKYIKSRVHPGEMVGALAAQSIGEPTTQLTLNTFHSAGTVKANATSGVPRIGELLSATHNPKQPLNFIYLSKEKMKSEDDATRILKEIQNTTLRDITKSVRIYYDPDPSTPNTAVKEDAEMLKAYQRWATTQGQACTSPWIIRLELDPFKVAALPKSIDMAMIASKIQNNRSLKVFDCVPNNTNTIGNKLILRITFTPEIVKNALALRFIEDKLLDTVLAGVDGIGRVYRRELNRELYYDEMVGGYAPTKQFVLDGEGTNLLEIALNPNTDPYRSFSNDVHEVLDIFGIETARICLYEEFSEVFESSGINYHHMIMLIDSMTAPGYILSTDRTGVNKNDEMGVLAKSSFEETAKHLFNAAVSAEYDNMRGVSANIMFGQKPPCGTGFVDILIDETKLPEGPEESESLFDSELEATNKKVQEIAEQSGQNNLQVEDLSFWA